MSGAVETLNAALDQEREHIDRTDVDEFLSDGDDDNDTAYQKPWDQILGETVLEYELFSLYRDSGPGRSASQVASYITQNPAVIASSVAPKTSRLRRLSQKNNWVSRATSWDRAEDEKYQIARSQAMRAMVARHEGVLSDAIDSLMVPIDALNKRIEDEPDFISTLSQTSVTKLISMAASSAKAIPNLMTAERLARGMPTEIVSGTIEHQHIDVSRDQIGALLGILDKAGVLNVGSGDPGNSEIVDATVVEVHSLPADDNE